MQNLSLLYHVSDEIFCIFWRLLRQAHRYTFELPEYKASFHYVTLSSLKHIWGLQTSYM